jgi:hypothetical protein
MSDEMMTAANDMGMGLVGARLVIVSRRRRAVSEGYRLKALPHCGFREQFGRLSGYFGTRRKVTAM